MPMHSTSSLSPQTPASDTDLATPHPLQPFWALAAAPLQAEALALALESGVLDDLLTPCTAADVAAVHGWHAGNTAHWLELLWAMGVLQRGDAVASSAAPRYGLTPLARRYLHSASIEACGAAWLFRLRSLRHSAALLRDQVAHGPAAQGSPAPFAQGNADGWAAAARAQIGQEQRAVTVPAALAVLQRVPEVAGARYLLDLGGGPGEVALALVRQHPALRATVFDWPAAVAVAAENAAQAGVADRVRTRGGDLAQAGPQGDIGAGYDVVWCSSVLHFVPDPLAVLRKVFDALEPGGVFVCVHAEVADAPDTALRVLPYYTPMRLLGRGVMPQGAMQGLLAQAGFVGIECLEARAFPMAPVVVWVGRKVVEGEALG